MLNFINKILSRARVQATGQGEINAAAPHPAVQLLIWLYLSVAAHSLDGYGLFILAGIIIAFALWLCTERFFRLIGRMRWILFSVLLIYAYTTPGESLWMQLGVFSPARDGMIDGLLQLLRLTAVLAGLSILLTLLSPGQLIAGLYTLAYPLRFFGLSRERFAVRLALTLHYAENAASDVAEGWRGNLEQLLAAKSEVTEFIELYAAHLALRDWLLIAAASVALAGVWL